MRNLNALTQQYERQRQQDRAALKIVYGDGVGIEAAYRLVIGAVPPKQPVAAPEERRTSKIDYAQREFEFVQAKVKTIG